MSRHLLAPALALLLAAPVRAGEVIFDATGTVASVSGATGAYSGVAAGQPAHLVFRVTTPGTDVVPGHETNYAIVPGSLQLTLGPATVGVVSGTPTAMMRNQDPAVDGVLASAVLTGSKNLGFSFSDCNGSMFVSTDPEQNVGSWSGFFYCVFGFTVSGSGTFIDIDLSTFSLALPVVGTPFCFGDASSSVPCPCANTGASGRGCDNSLATGGALLAASGATAPDTIVLTSSGELASVLSIFLQGTVALTSPLPFGDGLRCVGGSLRRLYVKNAVGGSASAPAAGDPSVSAQSALLGDPLAPGSTRWYQTYYRDPNLGFCAAPTGNTFNVSSGLRLDW